MRTDLNLHRQVGTKPTNFPPRSTRMKASYPQGSSKDTANSAMSTLSVRVAWHIHGRALHEGPTIYRASHCVDCPTEVTGYTLRIVGPWNAVTRRQVQGRGKPPVPGHAGAEREQGQLATSATPQVHHLLMLTRERTRWVRSALSHEVGGATSTRGRENCDLKRCRGGSTASLSWPYANPPLRDEP